MDYFGTAGVQHIALNTPDIISAVRIALRVKGGGSDGKEEGRKGSKLSMKALV